MTHKWYIGDFGFCGPVDKHLNGIYGNLPYIAPEVLLKKEYTFASDIYSIGMLMWEISSGQSPFFNDQQKFELWNKIVDGTRPETVAETPLKYKKLMEKCWNADPLQRPNINVLLKKMKKINKSYLNELNKNSFNQNILSELNKKRSFDYEPFSITRNITEVEQEAFHSKPYSFNIPDNVSEFNNVNNKKIKDTSKIIVFLIDYGKRLFRLFRKSEKYSENKNVKICNNPP
ncbi:2283_t:CDS:2 [Funneliformis geosporum]|uniref:9299_t:CDS:1 n=1 Tax=Funneliformis geosporum TaxID=1117311 RepID=A0A9W4SQM5_9GLOM|nr:2283_t:CDS:2 [Funneliformis geosporum]CAI2178053.1 9299_t:CDS:2 [Funneliformis geosporum]